MGRINHPAAIVAAVVYFLIGAGWYTALSAQWLAGIGKTMEEMQKANAGATPYLVGFAAILVLVYMLAWLMQRLAITDVAGGAKLGIVIAIGVIGAGIALNYGFELRPVSLWLINTGYAVVGMGASGAIMGAWKKKS